MKTNYKKLGKNTLLFAVGSFAQKAMSFVFVPFYTAVLTTADYGISDLIITICSLIWPVFTLLIDDAVLRFSLDKGESKEQIVSIGLYINLLGFLAMLVCSPIILLVSSLRPYYVLFVLYYFAYMINSFFSYSLRGLEKTRLFSLSGIISTGIAISCNLLFLLVFRLGVVGYLLSFIVAFIVTGIIQFFAGGFRKYILSPKLLDKETRQRMLKYAIPLIPNSISWWVSNSSDKVILSAICGVAVNGVYSVAYKIPSLITVCSSIFSNAWQISAVDGFGTEENRQYFSDIYYKYSTSCMYMVTVIITFNRLICGYLFSNDFYTAWVYVPILVYAVSFQIMSGFLGTIYTTAKKTWMVFISTIIAAGTNIILNVILIPFIGGIGAATATCISYMLIWAIRVIDSRKIMILDVDWKKEIITNILLFIQVIAGCINNMKCLLVSVLIMIVVLLIKRDFMKEIMLFGKEKLKYLLRK